MAVYRRGSGGKGLSKSGALDVTTSIRLLLGMNVMLCLLMLVALFVYLGVLPAHAAVTIEGEGEPLAECLIWGKPGGVPLYRCADEESDDRCYTFGGMMICLGY